MAARVAAADTGAGRAGRLRARTRLVARVALAATAASFAVASGARADAGISVRLPDRTEFVSAQRISEEADVAPRDYTLRARPGEPGEVNTYGGLSVRKLVELAGAAPNAVGFIQVPRADGTSSYLRGADLADPPPFPEGPALVFSDGGAIRYFRPVRGPDDANAADNIATVTGDPLTVTVHTGRLLTVTAHADRTSTHARQRVSFSATTTGAQDGEHLTYDWRFDDGATAGGRTATHAYKAAGNYAVIVTVTGDGDSGGSSEVLRIQVGDPVPGKHAGGGGSGNEHAPGSGPARGGHGGGSGGSGGGGAGQGSGGGGHGGGGGGGSGAGRADGRSGGRGADGVPGGSGAPPPGQPPPVAAAPAAAPPAAVPPAPAPGRHDRTDQTKAGHDAGNSLPAREQVSGVLLSAAPASSGSAVTEASAPSAAAPGTKASARRGTTQSGAAAPAAGFIALGLVGLGAVTERRRFTRTTP